MNTLLPETNSVLLIHADAIRDNIDSVLSSLPNGCRLIPVLKDDAYGLGLERISGLFSGLDTVNTLAVSHISEALELRRTGWHGEILVLSAPVPFQIPAAVRTGCTLSVFVPSAIELLEKEAAEQNVSVRIQLKIETGLHRGGIAPSDELLRCADLLHRCPHVRLTGIYSHLRDAEADDFCKAQYRLLLTSAEHLEQSGIPVPMKHLLASAGLERHPEYALDAVRIGRRLYYDHPTAPIGGIREAVSWRTCITAIFPRRKGERIGYGSGIVLERDMVTATIGVGYGDGMHPQTAVLHAPVLVHGMRCPVLYCYMDQSTVDITDIADRCQIGDPVTLFGPSEDGSCLPAQELALLLNAEEGCALTSALSPRVTRILLSGKEATPYGGF